MKIVILGPAVNKTISGGVAVFDEGLYNGFLENGHEVFLISGNKSSTISNITISKNDILGNRVPFYFNKIGSIIKKIQPDLIISSLQYSIGISTYKRYYSHGTYVQVLHGFPCEINGVFKAKTIDWVAKKFGKYFDYNVTVSFLSYAINKKIKRVKCDKIIHNGCNLEAFKNKRDKQYDFIYIGRLFRDKEVEMICDAFTILSKTRPDLRFAVAGYGEMERLFTNGKFSNTPIKYLGKLSQKEVSETLGKTKFFISMNPLEPFGIVFAEALVSGCNIITQSTSGFASNFIKKPYYHIADATNPVELSQMLENINASYYETSFEEKKEIAEYFSYKRVANEYIQLINKNKE